MTIKEKKYRDLQVEYAPGVYAGFSMFSPSIFFIEDNLLYFILGLFFIALFILKDSPLRFLLSQNRLACVTFMSLLACTNIIPLVIFFLADSPLSELIRMLIIPVGSVSIFIFVWCYYTHENLQKHGWVSVSDKWGGQPK